MNKIYKKTDMQYILKCLHKALRLEFKAAYDYWHQSYNVTGEEGNAIAASYEELAKEEWKHAKKLAERIKELECEMHIDFSDMTDEPLPTYCSMTTLKYNQASEQEMIELYNEIAQYTEGKDYVTHRMVVKILDDEFDHITLIDDYIGDIEEIERKRK